MAATLQPTTAPQKLTKGSQAAGTETSTLAGIVVDAGSERCMVVCVGGEGSGVATGGPWITALTYNAVTLTRLGEIRHNAWSWCEIWYMIAPPVGSATLSVTTGNPDILTATVMVAQGVDQTTPLRTAVSSGGGTASAATTSATVSGVVTGDLAFSVIDVDGSGHSTAPGTNQTQQSTQEYSGLTSTCVSTKDGVNGGTMAYTWTTAGDFSHLASAFIASGGATFIAPRPRIVGQAVQRSAVR